MFNLTHDETSALDVGGIWTGPDEFELSFRFNHDDKPDFLVHLRLDHEELKRLTDYLHFKLAQVRLH
jgi:hypothetical protein